MDSNGVTPVLPIFEDAWTNAIWAKQRIDNFDPFFAHYAKTSVSASVKMINPDSPDYAQHFIAEAQPFPFPLGIAVGEIIRNLRASLDYAVCAMASAQGATDAALEGFYFPIARDENAYENIVESRAIKNTLSGLRPFFRDQVKATPTGNRALWSLNEIDRLNKHRSIPVIFTTIFTALPDWPGARGNVAAVNPGGKIAISIPRQLYFEENHQFDRAVDVRFGRMNVFEGEPVIPVLAQLFHATTEMLGEIQTAYVAADVAPKFYPT